jgi:YHS domain-containing protein
MTKTLLAFSVFICSASCKSKPQEAAKPAIDTTAAPKKDLSSIKFSNTKDPVCGMKLKFGIGDSTLYKGKTIAFCSDGCKAEFLKNPSGYVVK